MLLVFGANVNSLNSDTQTPVDIANQSESQESQVCTQILSVWFCGHCMVVCKIGGAVEPDMQILVATDQCFDL